MLESQARSVEYGQMFRYDALRPQLLEHMPPLDAVAYARSAAAAGKLDQAPAELVLPTAQPLVLGAGLDSAAASLPASDQDRVSPIKDGPAVMTSAVVQHSKDSVPPKQVLLALPQLSVWLRTCRRPRTATS